VPDTACPAVADVAVDVGKHMGVCVDHN